MDTLRYLLMFILLTSAPAWSHDIYTNVHGKDGQLCCGDQDCFPTFYRNVGGDYEIFIIAQNRWLRVPEERITFLPIPGDPSANMDHRAHICYRIADDGDKASLNDNITNRIIDGLVVWCVFINPGST